METGSASNLKYRLVVFQEPVETEPVRIMMARELAIHPLDAQRLVAHMPGILPGLYDAGQCKRVLNSLFEFQLPAEARSQESFPDLSRPKSVHEFNLTPGGLNICDVIHKQTINFLPWNQIGMIAAAKLELPAVVTEYYPPGIVAGAARGVRRILGGGALNRKDRIVHSPIAPKGEAIIWRKRPHGVFRLSEEKLRYEILGEHLAETATENFPRLLRWLAAGADNAFLPESSLIYLGRKGGEIPVYPDLESLAEMATMELLRSWYRSDRSESEDTMS
ncbi:MAG: hypothetical protein NT172_01530 [Planctomycetota bacterium]|nr:hypothetical protein [Planctomycetota bacterium]